MNTLSLSLKSYTIYLGLGLLQSALLHKLCVALNKRVVIITDSHLIDSHAKAVQTILAAQGLKVDLLSFAAGEGHKTRDTKQQLEDELLSRGYARDTCLIALGGGLVCDLVGFLAATYCRGVPVIYIPTTLLAMVDASIGGKTGVNTLLGKNIIGTFTQPHAVLIDPHVLATLPDKEWRNGIAEMLKHGMIADANLFHRLQEASGELPIQDNALLIDVIHKNCLIKKNIVEQDEREQGLRQILNFGHTIGHAIETIEAYHIGHGEAVAIGMLVECYLAVQAGYLQPAVLMMLHDVLKRYGLPLKTIAFQNKAQFLQTLTLDKKSIQSVPRFVLLTHIGKPHHQDEQYTFAIDPKHLDRALDWALAHF